MTLKPDRRNANKGTQRGRGLLEKSLRQYGAGRSILVDADDNIIAGNKTHEVAAEIGLPVRVIETDGNELIAVKRTDLTLDNGDNRARELAYLDNRVGQIDLEWDVTALLEDAAKGIDLDALGFRDDEVKELLAKAGMEAGGNGEQDAEPQIDKAAELQAKWGTALGQLWEIGQHRLVCGDCTDAECINILMGGELARMVFEDPPYNVSYQDNESIESLKARNRRTDGLVVSNDSMSDDEFDKFLISCLSVLPLVRGGAFYLCAPPGRTETQFRVALECVSGLTLRECIVWVKDVFVFGGQDYHWRHESILYGWKDGAAHYFVDDHTQDTVWECDRPKVSKEHPTMKPVELPQKAISNSSKDGEIVFDGFGGSGTTMVACQNLNRKCRMIEISPAYCAVILQRMADLGLTPKLVS